MRTNASLHGRAIRRARRGISLIEALVAMAIMAFGMLGVLGLQSTLRASADLSKQRSEATRLAQERVEDWRSFSVVPVTTGVKSYASIPAGTTIENLGSFVSNASYTRTSVVTETPTQKTLRVDVSWEDRAGTTQNVRLFSVVARVSPDVAATMVAAPVGAGGTREPEGRRRGIPPQAKNFGDGTSGFRTPQVSGTAAVWVFNNVTGLITSVCDTAAVDNATLTLAGLTNCVTTQAYQLITGYIRASTSSTQPTAAEMANPNSVGLASSTFTAEVAQTAPTTGTIACRHDRAATYVQYFCAIPVTSPTPATWAGTLRINAASLPQLAPDLANSVLTNVKVCRYRAAATYATTATNGPLANQNLALIPAGDGATPFTCPSPPTFAHQPAA